ncbi:stalk domain-containing protein [Brevibacillus sp. SYSU BS000544]|uniref:stalk domain-containing protein n=1 Tax=Brevibacillus sp. SYSU BS000544 TaxID=3416443 RepID=UPI003CE49380
MKQKIASVLFSLILLFGLLVPAQAASEGSGIFLDGNKLEVSSTVENGRTLVPMRAIFEALGAQVNWDQASKTVTATKGETVVKIVIGGKAYKNDQEVTLDVPAKVVDNITLVPLRFVSEALGAKVEFNQETKDISITSQGDAKPGETATNETPFEKYLNGLPYNTDKLAGVNRTAQFIITGEHAGEYALVIKDNKVTWTKEKLQKEPAITVTTTEKIWLSIAERKLDAKDAYLRKLIKAEGSLSFFLESIEAFQYPKAGEQPPATPAQTGTTTPQSGTTTAQSGEKPKAETPFEEYLNKLPINAGSLEGVDKEAQFIITGEHAGEYALLIKDNKIVWSKGKSKNPAVTVTTTEQVWLDVSSRKLDPATTLQEGKFKVEGTDENIAFFIGIISAFVVKKQ